MKYVMLFMGTKEGDRQYEALSQQARDAHMATIMNWFGRHSDKIRGGYELQAERTATTVRGNNGKPVITDGPFIEGKEAIGGYAEIEVADLDEAIAMAKEWPGTAVELRPVVDRGEGPR